MRRPSAQKLWLVLVALAAVCLFGLAAMHSHAGHADTQCWLCAASVGHLALPVALAGLIQITLIVSFLGVSSVRVFALPSPARIPARAPPIL